MLFGNVARCMLVRTVACGNHFLKQRSFLPCAYCFAVRRTGEQGNKGNGNSEVKAYLCFLLAVAVAGLGDPQWLRSAVAGWVWQ